MLRSLSQEFAPEKREIDATRFKHDRAEDELAAVKATALADSIRVLRTENGSQVRIITDGAKVNVFKNDEVLIITVDKAGQYSLQHQTKAGGAIDGRVSPNAMTQTNMMDTVTGWLRH